MTGESVTPVEVQVTRYRCPTCRRGWARRSAAQLHIDRLCPHDPESRCCLTCKHFFAGTVGGFGYSEPGEDPACEAGLTLTHPLPRCCTAWEAQP